MIPLPDDFGRYAHDYPDYNPEPPEDEMSETVQTTVSQEILSEEEISVLADARRTLKDIIKRVEKLHYDPRVKSAGIGDVDGYRIGRIVESLDTAEHAVFAAMNTASTFGGVEMDYNSLHAAPLKAKT